MKYVIIFPRTTLVGMPSYIHECQDIYQTDRYIGSCYEAHKYLGGTLRGKGKGRARKEKIEDEEVAR